MIVMPVFLSILNQMEIHLVQNRKENCHHDHIPFNVKGNGNIFFSVQSRLQCLQRSIGRPLWSHSGLSPIPHGYKCVTLSGRSFLLQDIYRKQTVYFFHSALRPIPHRCKCVTLPRWSPNSDATSRKMRFNEYAPKHLSDVGLHLNLCSTCQYLCPILSRFIYVCILIIYHVLRPNFLQLNVYDT